MKRIVPAVLSALLLILLAAAACVGPQPTVRGERCRSADLNPGDSRSVEVGELSFWIGESWTLIECSDSPMRGINVAYIQLHDEREHTFVFEVSLVPLDPSATSNVARPEILQTLVEGRLAAPGNPRFVDLKWNSNDLRIVDAECLGWDMTQIDTEPLGLVDQSWPMRFRAVACLDPAAAPSFVVIAEWSERRPPDIEPLSDSEVLARADPMLTSLRIAPGE